MSETAAGVPDRRGQVAVTATDTEESVAVKGSAPGGANRSPRPWTSSLGRIMKAAKPWVQRAFTVAVIAAAVAV
ncbi:MAG: hypothetical protein J2P59_12195, partial [Acidimicrobiales bacterium]|nr:hypothetical protein [Acidimicrobiales bacterium]